MMYKKHIKSLVVLILSNTLVFLLHMYFKEKCQDNATLLVLNLNFSYAVNALASVAICTFLWLLLKKNEAQIGFIFLGLSTLKAIALFFLLDPTNNLGAVATTDAFSFFIPFALNLILELVFIVKLLKISNLSTGF